MAVASSADMPLGTSAPDFTLPDPHTAKAVSLADFAGRPLVVVFMCNHCPYVVHIVDQLVALADEFTQRGVNTVAISANDVQTHPADSPEKMAALAEQKHFGFPYLFDESQAVAKAYGAVCTPDIYVFDAKHKLYYRGQFDGTRPGQGAAATGDDLRAALEALTAGQAAPTSQTPSVGCSIKWTPAA